MNQKLKRLKLVDSKLDVRMLPCVLKFRTNSRSLILLALSFKSGHQPKHRSTTSRVSPQILSENFFSFSVLAIAQQSPADPRQSSNRLGLVVRELAPAQRKALGIEYGLLVEDAQGGQLQRGDIILAVNNVYFKSLEEFNRLVQQQPAGGIVALLVRRGDAALYIPMRVGSK